MPLGAYIIYIVFSNILSQILSHLDICSYWLWWWLSKLYVWGGCWCKGLRGRWPQLTSCSNFYIIFCGLVDCVSVCFNGVLTEGVKAKAFPVFFTKILHRKKNLCGYSQIWRIFSSCRNSLVKKSGRNLFVPLINSKSKSKHDSKVCHLAKICFKPKF